jgi:hypothetical protein
MPNIPPPPSISNIAVLFLLWVVVLAFVAYELATW